MNDASTGDELPAASAASDSARRLVLLLVIVASIGYVCRVDMTVVGPALMAEFHLSQTRMGELFSAFLVGYTVFQIPSGWLADRVGARPLFLTLPLGWALLTAALVAVGTGPLGAGLGALSALLLLRLFLGIIAAPTYPASARAIAVSVPERWQGRANGAVLASIGIGSAITPPLLGYVSARCGWRAALLVAAGFAVGAALIWRTYAPRQYLARTFQGRSAIELPSPAWPSPLGRPSFWFLAASYTLQGYVGYVFVFWFYLYLVQVRHFDLLKAAWVTTLPWVSTLVAIPLGGVFSDAAAKLWGSTWGRRAVSIPALILSASFLALGALTKTSMLAVTALTLSTALVLCTEGPYWAAMNQLSGPRSGTAGGVMNFGSNLGGMISPALTPWLAGRWGWAAALSLTALLAVIAALFWLGVEIEHRPAPLR